MQNGEQAKFLKGPTFLGAVSERKSDRDGWYGGEVPDADVQNETASLVKQIR